MDEGQQKDAKQGPRRLAILSLLVTSALLVTAVVLLAQNQTKLGAKTLAWACVVLLPGFFAGHSRLEQELERGNQQSRWFYGMFAFLLAAVGLGAAAVVLDNEVGLF